jgi:hypothetical protein
VLTQVPTTAHQQRSKYAATLTKTATETVLTADHHMLTFSTNNNNKFKNREKSTGDTLKPHN